MPTPLVLSVQAKLKNSSLHMDTPCFVITAGEWLSNRGDVLDPDTIGFLATRMELDMKVR